MSQVLSSRFQEPGRWLLIGALAAGLFAVGMDPEAVFAALTRAWQAVFSSLGLGDAMHRWQQGTSHLVTTRSLPVVITYSLLYVGACFLLLHLLLRNAQRTRWAGQLYLALLAAAALLLVGGKLAGNLDWAYKLGRRIIDFVVSPLPVMLLLPLLWPGRGRAPRN